MRRQAALIMGRLHCHNSDVDLTSRAFANVVSANATTCKPSNVNVGVLDPLKAGWPSNSGGIAIRAMFTQPEPLGVRQYAEGFAYFGRAKRDGPDFANIREL
jgi:hypothetical protein